MHRAFRFLDRVFVLPVMLGAVLSGACDEQTPAALVPPDGSASPLDGGNDGAPEDATQPIELKFEGRVGSEPFSCTRTYEGIGTTNATASAGDLRFFVHDVVLIRAGTKEEVKLALATNAWQNPEVALVDLEDHVGACTGGTDGTNDVVTGTAPAGEYEGIRFVMGMPQALNHVNVETAAPPLPASKLQWTWANGFLHLSTEVRSTKTEALGDGGVRAKDPFYAHIGSTGCSGDVATGGMKCARPNRPTVALTGFDPNKSKIIIDLKALYAGSNIDENATATVPGCMGADTDTDCGPLFERLGLDFTSGLPNGAASPVFSVVAR